jgi:hypothetical protein
MGCLCGKKKRPKAAPSNPPIQAVQEIPVVSPALTLSAEKLREQGNAYFTSKDYSKAIQSYSNAIVLLT